MKYIIDMPEKVYNIIQGWDDKTLSWSEKLLKTATPIRPKGHWIKGYTFPDGNYCKCSECKEIIKCIYPMHYCPNCGAKMESEVEDGNVN